MLRPIRRHLKRRIRAIRPILEQMALLSWKHFRFQLNKICSSAPVSVGQLVTATSAATSAAAIAAAVTTGASVCIQTRII